MKRGIYFLILATVLFLTGCAMDTLQEDTLTFDLTDDIWNGFEYLHHVTDFDHLQKPLDLIFSDAYESC